MQDKKKNTRQKKKRNYSYHWNLCILLTFLEMYNVIGNAKCKNVIGNAKNAIGFIKVTLTHICSFLFLLVFVLFACHFVNSLCECTLWMHFTLFDLDLVLRFGIVCNGKNAIAKTEISVFVNGIFSIVIDIVVWVIIWFCWRKKCWKSVGKMLEKRVTMSLHFAMALLLTLQFVMGLLKGWN